MSWQEELRKLDEELAAGRLSADDYRVRRDQVLSSAVSHDDGPAQTPEAPTSGNAGSDQAASSADQNQQAASSDSTQVVQPITPPQSGQQPTADSTQVVQNPNFGAGTNRQAPEWQAQPPRHEQGMQQQGHFQPGAASPAGGIQQPQQSTPWNAPQQDMTPPWGGSDMPPTPPEKHGWSPQGPESFEDHGKGKGKVIAVALAAILVLGGIGTGIYFLSRGGGSPAATDDTTETATATQQPSSTPPPDDLQIAELPGKKADIGNIATFDDIIKADPLADQEYDIYKAANPSESRMAVAKLPSGGTVVVITVQVESAKAASTAVDELGTQQDKFGLKKYSGEAPENVTVQELAKTESGKALIRAHYTHENTVVRLQVDGADLAKLSKTFDRILAKQLNALSVGS